MLLPHGTVFALVDGENFELYRNSGTETDPKLEPIDTPDLAATNFSAGADNHDNVSRFTAGAPKGRERKLEELAHAAAVAHWLNQEVLQHRIESLVIIADPRSLGEMRRHYHKQLRSVLRGDVDATMTGAKPGAIVEKLRAVH